MTRTCPNCGAEVGEGRFCTACGARLPAASDEAGASPAPAPQPSPASRPTRPPLEDRTAEDDAARVVACPRCGAVNAASRRRCARCGVDLTADPDDLRRDAVRASSADPAGASRQPPSTSATPNDDDPPLPGVVVLAAAVAAIAVLAVGLTLLSARGVGPFAGPSADANEPTEGHGVEVTEVAATSALPAEGDRTYAAENLVDDEPTTAWNEGEPGDGVGERIDLVLAAPTRVTELLVWNGYQDEDFFTQHPRVRSLRLELGERRFTVQLLDRTGPQAIELPEPVITDRVRLTIGSVYPGDRYNDAALSEIEVRGVPRGGSDA